MPRMIAAFALSASLVASSQSGQQPPTFRTRVDLVQVDVVVVDREGRAIRGLKQADFAVLDRGKPQTIATFEEIAHTPETGASAPLPLLVSRDVAVNQGPQADRLVVIVVDDLHIWKDRTDRAKEITRRVSADLGARSSMAVLFTSGDHSTQVTQDPAVLSAAIDTLKGRQSWRRPHYAIDQMSAHRIDPEDSSQAALAKVQQAQENMVQVFSDNMRQYKTLQDAARMLGGGDTRRKAFVLVSEGIGKDLSGIFGAMRPQGTAPQGGLEYASGNLEALTEIPPTSYHDYALIDMMEAMRRSNVTTYAIDPRGKVESKDLALECFPAPHPGGDPCSEGLTDWDSPVRQAQHGLEMISDASGGFAVTNTNDFTSGLNRIVDDLDHYYLIGFYPSDTKGKGYRLLDVKVTGHPDWRLRFRRGYLPGAPPPAPKAADPLTSLSAGILPKTDLPLRLTAIASPGAASTNVARVVLALEVSAPRRDIQDADGKVRDTLNYEVLVVDEKKARVRSEGNLEGRLTLSPKAASEALPDTVQYQVMHALDVPPGRFEFRVSATSVKLNKGGSVYLGVTVPDFRSAPLMLGGLVVGYADGARVPTAPATAAQTKAQAAVPFPPSLDREFMASDTLRVHAEGSAHTSGRLTASVDVVNASGKVVVSPSPSFSTGDPVRIDAMVPLEGLPSGGYILRVTLRDPANSAVREAGIVIK